MKKKVIIDCDAGIDDALALILAFRSPDLEVKAVTAVNGNVPLLQVCENIQKVLSLLKPGRKPLIAKGADHPLKGKGVYASAVHGEDGLGGAKIEKREGEEWWKFFPGSADELITKMAREESHELILIALGPLTNLALGMQRDPSGMKHLKEVIVMGGAVRTKGNITPYAEFNFFVDPLAAQRVLNCGIPLTLVPLDVTQQVALTPQWVEDRIKPIQNPLSQFVLEATGYRRSGRQLSTGSSFYLHDPLAVGVGINPNLVMKEKLSISVVTDEGEHCGQVVGVPAGQSPEAHEVDVCLGVNKKEFLELFLSMLRN